MGAWTAERTTAAAVAELEQARVPCGEVLTPAQTLVNEQVVAGEFLVPTSYPGLVKPAPVGRTPVDFSKVETGIRRRAPHLGRAHRGDPRRIGLRPSHYRRAAREARGLAPNPHALKLGDHMAQAPDLTVLATGLQFPEGPYRDARRHRVGGGNRSGHAIARPVRRPCGSGSRDWRRPPTARPSDPTGRATSATTAASSGWSAAAASIPANKRPTTRAGASNAWS